MPPNATATTTTTTTTSSSVVAVSNDQKDMMRKEDTATRTPSSSTDDDEGAGRVFVYTSGAVTAETSIVEFGPSSHATGICFLDHMVDQLTSHGQLGVTMTLFTTHPDTHTQTHHQPHRDYAGGSLTDKDRLHDEDIFIAAGATLGMALRDLVQLRTGGPSSFSSLSSSSSQSSLSALASTTTSSSSRSRSSTSVFCCPLDEAFVEATLQLSTSSLQEPCTDINCDLTPYGSFPPQGRRWIGCYQCPFTTVFFENLAISLGSTHLSLRKIRGHNAHHIVESAFKAFARVFRACLDELTLGGCHGCVNTPTMESEPRLSARRREQQQQHQHEEKEEEQDNNKNNNNTNEEHHRTGSRSRSTKETTIEVHVDLDKEAPPPSITTSDDEDKNITTTTTDITTGVELTDQVLQEIRSCAGFYFSVHCNGDIYIDDHHTSEDVAITLGQCFQTALGNKAGLARMGCAEIPIIAASGAATTARVRCVMDLSNRPYFEWNLPFDEEYVGGDDVAFAAMRRGATRMNHNKNGAANNNANGAATAATMLCGSALTCEMLLHIFESLTIETRATVHLELITTATTDDDDDDPGRQPETRALAFAAAQAFGTALAECVRIDPRRAGKVASSKGTLSV